MCSQGYQDITYALQCNRSMRHIPFPTYDLQPAMKTSPERVDAIIRRMQVLGKVEFYLRDIVSIFFIAMFSTNIASDFEEYEFAKLLHRKYSRTASNATRTRARGAEAMLLG